MKKADVVIGAHYVAKVSGVLTTVKIDRVSPYGNGWEAHNIRTGRKVFIRSATRLRRAVEVAGV